MRTALLLLTAAFLATATSVALIEPVKAGSNLHGNCQQFLTAMRKGLSVGDSAKAQAVYDECMRRFKSAKSAEHELTKKRTSRREETKKLASEALEIMATTGVDHNKRIKADRNRRHNQNYRDAEAFLRSMSGLSQRKDPWDSVRKHGKKNKRH